MTLHDALLALQNTPLATAVAESPWMFPTVESIHVLAITFVVGSIAVVDLRLLGIAGRDQKITRLTHDILPWTWFAFVIAAIMGFLLFSSQAVAYFNNIPFRLKFVFMLLAGVNMLVFQFVTFKNVAKWDEKLPTPFPVKLAGALSLGLWVCVVAAGRWIGFTMFG